MKLFLEVYIIQGVFLCDHFQNFNDLSSNRPISINLGSKSTENIRILIYTTHKHIIILFFKMPSLIPKDHLQSSTEVLHGYSHHSIRHFLECRDYCGFDVTNIFVIPSIHFAFDVSPQKIVQSCSGDLAVQVMLQSCGLPLPIHRLGRFSFNQLHTLVDQCGGAPSCMKRC